MKTIDLNGTWSLWGKTQGSSENPITLVDPVMGDDGRLYPAYSPILAERMRSLVAYADILTPNLTEACILTDT
ncbi:MAG: hypothetical protein IIW31_08080, partial [Clostridia bacterium]|nr:hypothetical protein [Clostridia bacterium]